MPILANEPACQLWLHVRGKLALQAAGAREVWEGEGGREGGREFVFCFVCVGDFVPVGAIGHRTPSEDSRIPIAAKERESARERERERERKKKG